MLNYQLKDYHLSVLQKLRNSDTCNQVKSCTKHGKPDQGLPCLVQPKQTFCRPFVDLLPNLPNVSFPNNIMTAALRMGSFLQKHTIMSRGTAPQIWECNKKQKIHSVFGHFGTQLWNNQIRKLCGGLINFFTLIIQGPIVLPYYIIKVKLPQLHWIVENIHLIIPQRVEMPICVKIK